MAETSFLYVTYIATTPEKLWEALTREDISKKYFFGRFLRSEWKEGSTFQLMRDKGQIDHHGTVLKYAPNRLLILKWNVPDEDGLEERFSKVTFELHPMDSAVKLTLKHEDLLPQDFSEETDTFNAFNNGWPAILSNLKSLLETGRTLRPIS